MINSGNYEEYMTLLADGELNPTEMEELKAFVKGNKELEQELAYYMSARIVPDKNEIYAGKEDLLKKPAPARLIGLHKNWAYGIAAGILLLIFLGIFKWQIGIPNSKFQIPNSQIVKKDTTQTNSKSKFEIPGPKETPVAKQEQHPSTTPAPQKSVIVQTKTTKPINNIATVEKPKADTTNSIAANTLGEINLDSLMNSPSDVGDGEKKIRKIPGEIDKPLARQQIKIDSPPHIKYGWDRSGGVIVVSSIEPKHKRNFFARLPIIGKKNEGIGLVTDAVQNNISKAKQIKNNLKNTDVVIKIGNKELLAFNL